MHTRCKIIYVYIDAVRDVKIFKMCTNSFSLNKTWFNFYGGESMEMGVGGACSMREIDD